MQSTSTIKSEDVLPEYEAVSLPRPGRASAWLLVFALAYLMASFIYFIGFGIYAGATNVGASPSDIEQQVLAHSQSLGGLAGMYLVQVVFLLPLVLLVSRFRNQSWRETLAVRGAAARQFGFWLAIWALYQTLAILLNLVVEIEPGEFIQSMAGSRHLGVSLVVVLLAPLLEEVLFRGYLFKAWRHSWLGLSGTLIVTSCLFVALHFGQYGGLLLIQLFVFALILGMAREKTGSLLVPLVLHAVNNLFATLMITYAGVNL